MAAAVMTALAGCHDADGLLPQSGGNAYEVVLMAGGTEERALMDSLLSTDTPGLPQGEPLFSISHAQGSGINQATRYARCIVMVNTGRQYPDTRIRYEKNVYAQPQLIVNVSSPSARRLKADIGRLAPRLTELMVRFELNAEARRLRRHYNPKATEAVEQATGWTLRIPAEMKAMKRGHHFVWVSNNTATGLQNICVYTYPGTDISPEKVIRMRDSVMRANIPGERPGMYMSTEKRIRPLQRMRHERGTAYMETRGLWQMEGDAMGGPFVSHAIADTAHRRTVVAEGFVYAPESKKRGLTRQLEAVVCTLAKTGRDKKQ